MAITGGMQIVGFVLCYLLDYLFRSQETSTIFPLSVEVVLVLVCTVLGIVLPILWCKTTTCKIATILFMPTNYTVLVCTIVFVKFIATLGSILNDIPDNFG